MSNIRFPTRAAAFLLALTLGVSCRHQHDHDHPHPHSEAEQTDENEYAKTSGSNLVFAWPFMEPKSMPYRGGSTRGTEVTLATGNSPAWQILQLPAPSQVEKDRRAILAMAGDYRVSFQFTETAGFTDGYQPSKPYFSWGTEMVRVLADEPTFISLQHTLVMWFEMNGEVHGPMVMKHWRQDWRYEDVDLHEFQHSNTWQRRRVDSASVKGAWTQAVYQVDDSPRYEVIGRWQHGGGTSIWYSESCKRPLPRREFSVRDDYNVLEGRHVITITPTGWVHEQHNRKLNHDPQTDKQTYLAQEIGVNRYERITAPSLQAGDDSWAKTGAYWAAVRTAWDEVMSQNDRFQIKAKVDDAKLFEHHFGYAAGIEQGENTDADKATAHARETVRNFIVPK